MVIAAVVSMISVVPTQADRMPASLRLARRELAQEMPVESERALLDQVDEQGREHNVTRPDQRPTMPGPLVAVLASVDDARFSA